ncbi:pentatricopeptide repeat-containing protein At4g13650 isoform X2 [Neltuma alba]|uniref:pentatricopeptide repeat-containing protein At4g13650 isoform X2 n=1 Tax=Neltuma alba TaxID=207710 RepID=UPI0010A56A6A|nr:pentatricopeptide repeat-containing protein At4g13650 isoform X2 [Prosopis alba]
MAGHRDFECLLEGPEVCFHVCESTKPCSHYMLPQHFMRPTPLSIHRFFLSSKFSPFPCKFGPQICAKLNRKKLKFTCGNVRRFSLAAVSNTALSYPYDELPGQQNERETKDIDFLLLMEDRGIRANCQTYLWLLQGCLNSGSRMDSWRLHGKILKLGFYAEQSLCDQLMDVYISFDDLNGAIKVFDDMPTRAVSCWNKLIRGSVTKKLSNLVPGLFRAMIDEMVKPDEKTFAGVLRACGGNDVPLSYVELLHARIITHGFETSTLICNPLIEIYFKNGFVNSAKKVFDNLQTRDSVSWVAMISGLSQNKFEEEAILLYTQMHSSGIFPTPYTLSSVLSACTKIELFKFGEQVHGLAVKMGLSSEMDRVSYNSLISGLAQQGYSDRALELFKKMYHDCLKPDCVTVACLLSACASVGDLLKGRQLHSFAVKAGMSSDIILEGSLVDLYVKCSDIETAHEFFLTSETENVVLWNMMLVAYGQLDNLNESFDIFRQLLIKGIEPNQFTYPSILRTCTSLGALDLGEQIHTQALKTGFQFNVYVSSVLIDMYAKHGKLDTALKILRRLKEDDVVSWTAMIAGYAQNDMHTNALKLFKEMQDRGIQSDNIGFASAISACAGIQALDLGRQIHAQSCISGYSNDLSVGNALVTLYARNGKVREAYLAFEKIFDKNNVSWNSLVSGFAQSEHFEDALSLFAKMHQSEVEINFFTFGSAVSAAANMANIKVGVQIHAMIKKTGYDSEIEVSNALISLYAKCGNINDAKRQFFEMPEKNEVSWNSMITGYSQHGLGYEALSLFEDMKQLGVMPNHVTFVGVLSACSHVGLVDEGIRYFESIIEAHNLVPKPEHYACVVDLLGRARLLSRAKRFIETMPIQPDAMIWRTLLSACTIHKNIDIGEFAARHLLELAPEDSATYVLLSNMYAITGKWGCRDRARQMMKDRGVKKEPGRSWIEVNNSIHAFFAGDQLHPLVDKIYARLRDLDERAADNGYEPQRNSLLSDAEREQKDPTQIIHSEKLAIAFGLLCLSSSSPVRVFKNLRVCGDCHNWIKHVSKISDRVIIVRDAYRFHHFEGGECSCQDYW